MARSRAPCLPAPCPHFPSHPTKARPGWTKLALSGRLADPAMPPLAGQRLLNAPAAGWSSAPPLAPGPARHPGEVPPEGPAGAAAGSRSAGDPGLPHLPPALPPPAATGPSLLPRPPTPCVFGVRICATCGQPQPRALPTLPADRARFPGSVPGPAPPGRSCPIPDGRTDA